MNRRANQRDEEGSIGVVMIVMLVTSLLLLATIAAVDSGHRVANRHGDSANALQAADSGINYLLKRVPDAPQTTGYSFSCPSGIKLGRATYECSATFDRSAIGQVVWHLDSIATDTQSGLKRHVRADAVAEPLFQRPLYVRALADLSSGVSLDSYTDGTSAANKCTKQGILGISTPTLVSFGTSGGGVGVTNCQNTLLGNGWAYSMDGCSLYYDPPTSAPAVPAGLTGSGRCPPVPHTKAVTPTPVLATPSAANAPGVVVSGTTNLVCDTARPLLGNRSYVFPSVSLRNGCSIQNPELGSVNLYITNTVDIGTTGGSNNVINPPPVGTTSVASALCGATAVLPTPDWYYCPGWTTSLIVNVTGTASPVVNLNNNGMRFWGAINAPTAQVRVRSPQIEMFGGVIADSLTSVAQFTWHYDDSLTKIGTGRYFLRNWREEPS